MDEDGPPNEEEGQRVGAANGAAAGETGLLTNHVALFEWLQETSRKEAQGRYEKWAWLKGMKARTGGARPRGQESGQGVSPVKADANERLRKLGRLEPPLAPSIEELICQANDERNAKGEFQTLRTSHKSTRKSRRGRRQRGEKPFQVVTVNTSGYPQLQEALAVEGLAKRCDAAILCQEHHRRGEQLGDLQTMARRQMDYHGNWSNAGRRRRAVRRGRDLYFSAHTLWATARYAI